MREMMNSSGQQAPPHPKMLVYRLAAAGKGGTGPEPEETRIGFKPATLPGSKASPAIDETFMLLPGLLPRCSTPQSRAICLARFGSPARPGLLDQGRAANGSRHADHRPLRDDEAERRQPSTGDLGVRPYPERHLGSARRRTARRRSRPDRFGRRGQQPLPATFWRRYSPHADRSGPANCAGRGK